MKKIGILTMYFNSQNIGGLLQSYALPLCLQRYGMEAEQVSFNYLIRSKWTQCNDLWVVMSQLSVKQFFLKFFRHFIHSNAFTSSTSYRLQAQLFEQFRNVIPHTTQIYCFNTLNKLDKVYDILIIGSDQVWGKDFLNSLNFFGGFTTKIPLVSYAASSNTIQFSHRENVLFSKKLNHFTHISVREKTLKDYVERITDKKVTVVLDPTFLLSPQEWLKIANPAPVPQKPYIFCYFLGEKSAWQRKIAQDYADKYGYEVVHLPYIMQSVRPADQFLKGQGRYDVGPREFIALINGAQCVFTDSFHGLAFSINFGKNFYVFNRNDESGVNSMNARITDTLSTFGLTTRHITDKNAVLDNKPLDFTQAHNILAREKEKSINWLLNALKD